MCYRSTGTGYLAFEFNWAAYGFTRSADIFKVLTVFLFYGDNEVVIIIGYYLKDILRACLNALAAAIAFIGVNDYIVVSRAIGVTIICDIAW